MISGLITYALTCGDGDAELHDKEVALTTSDVTGSQTAIFEYDPQNEPTTGTPAGPWDGYSLFTIDLSGVKDDIEDLQQQIADLEDELEACHDCRDEVVAALQQYDPDYDPDEGECPADKVTEVVDKVEELEEQVEECDQCKADVIAKLQEYDPDFDPQTCEDIPPEIDKIVDENKGVVVPDGVDPAPIALELKGAVTDDDIHASVQIVCRIGPDTYIETPKVENPPYNTFYPFVKISYIQDGAEMINYLPCIGDVGLNANGEYGMITGYSISTSGIVTISGVWHYLDGSGWHDMSLSGQTYSQHLVGWGDTGHTQRITN